MRSAFLCSKVLYEGYTQSEKRNHSEDGWTAYLSFCFGVGLVIPVNVAANVERVFPVGMGGDVQLTFDVVLGRGIKSKERAGSVLVYI